VNRRRVLTGLGGLAGVTALGAIGLELVARGVLPGKQTLDQLDGACSVQAAVVTLAAPGAIRTGTFYSQARRRRVAYSVAYPPGHRPGDRLPLIVWLHAFGGLHDSMPAQLLSMRRAGRPLAPMAMAAADGGGLYWNPHPGDDPMGMVIDELIPMCQRMGVGRPGPGGQRRIGTSGISMGGYGAILLAEKYPGLIGAVAAIAPAIWTSYEQARSVNPSAYASATAFDRADAVTHAAGLATVAVRVASGADDPFHPGVEALVRALPRGAVVDIGPGCHTAPFFDQQEPPSLEFLGRHLSDGG
jgi:pimeloyl-ACP methyl ester carboxylesterase